MEVEGEGQTAFTLYVTTENFASIANIAPPRRRHRRRQPPPACVCRPVTRARPAVPASPGSSTSGPLTALYIPRLYPHLPDIGEIP